MRARPSSASRACWIALRAWSRPRARWDEFRWPRASGGVYSASSDRSGCGSAESWMTGMARSDNLDQLIERRQRLEARQTAEPEFAQRLQELRAWQAARLAQTYQDLRRDPQLSPAVEFFLSDLYGPQDFTRRNLELTRAWRYLKRALPEPALEVLGQAIELEVWMGKLGGEVGPARPRGPRARAPYAPASRALGLPDARQHQIDLIIGI